MSIGRSSTATSCRWRSLTVWRPAATQLSEITGQVADSKDNAGYAVTAARLRVAASVFGG